MPYIVLSGAKSIGAVKRKSKSKINSILASEYKRTHNVRISKLTGIKIKNKIKR